MGKFEYLLVTLRPDTYNQAVVDTVNGEKPADNPKLAHEYLNEMGGEHWELFTSFTFTAEHPTFVLKRQVQIDYTARAMPAMEVTPPLFPLDKTY